MAQPTNDEVSAGRSNTIRVVVVDDHSMVAELLSNVISTQPDMQVVGIAGDIEEGLACVAREQPDVVFMDYRLPSGDGITCAADIKRLHPKIRVLILTGQNADDVVVRAVKEGCDGFVRKTAHIDQMIDAVRRAHDGDPVFTPTDLSKAMRQIRGTSKYAELSDRESDVLRLMAQGESTADLAAKLFISVHTVRSHVRHILEKLGAHSKLEAVSIASRQGLVDLSS